ncbi:hypothetical protein TSMEX_001950 [Taenia solium]|eukprot:TsM_001123400 transcript=TsM_001123400 gene=TsM_001123400
MPQRYGGAPTAQPQAYPETLQRQQLPLTPWTSLSTSQAYGVSGRRQFGEVRARSMEQREMAFGCKQQPLHQQHHPSAPGSSQSVPYQPPQITSRSTGQAHGGSEHLQSGEVRTGRIEQGKMTSGFLHQLLLQQQHPTTIESTFSVSHHPPQRTSLSTSQAYGGSEHQQPGEVRAGSMEEGKTAVEYKQQPLHQQHHPSSSGCSQSAPHHPSQRTSLPASQAHCESESQQSGEVRRGRVEQGKRAFGFLQQLLQEQHYSYSLGSSQEASHHPPQLTTLAASQAYGGSELKQSGGNRTGRMDQEKVTCGFLHQLLLQRHPTSPGSSSSVSHHPPQRASLPVSQTHSGIVHQQSGEVYAGTMEKGKTPVGYEQQQLHQQHHPSSPERSQLESHHSPQLTSLSTSQTYGGSERQPSGDVRRGMMEQGRMPFGLQHQQHHSFSSGSSQSESHHPPQLTSLATSQACGESERQQSRELLFGYKQQTPHRQHHSSPSGSSQPESLLTPQLTPLATGQAYGGSERQQSGEVHTGRMEQGEKTFGHQQQLPHQQHLSTVGSSKLESHHPLQPTSPTTSQSYGGSEHQRSGDVCIEKVEQEKTAVGYEQQSLLQRHYSSPPESSQPESLLTPQLTPLATGQTYAGSECQKSGEVPAESMEQGKVAVGFQQQPPHQQSHLSAPGSSQSESLPKFHLGSLLSSQAGAEEVRVQRPETRAMKKKQQMMTAGDQQPHPSAPGSSQSESLPRFHLGSLLSSQAGTEEVHLQRPETRAMKKKRQMMTAEDQQPHPSAPGSSRSESLPRFHLGSLLSSQAGAEGIRVQRPETRAMKKKQQMMTAEDQQPHPSAPGSSRSESLPRFHLGSLLSSQAGAEGVRVQRPETCPMEMKRQMMTAGGQQPHPSAPGISQSEALPICHRALELWRRASAITDYALSGETPAMRVKRNYLEYLARQHQEQEQLSTSESLRSEISAPSSLTSLPIRPACVKGEPQQPLETCAKKFKLEGVPDAAQHQQQHPSAHVSSQSGPPSLLPLASSSTRRDSAELERQQPSEMHGMTKKPRSGADAVQQQQQHPDPHK